MSKNRFLMKSIFFCHSQKAGFLNELRPGSGGASPVKEPPAEDDWSENPGHDKVHMLTDATAEKFLNSHEAALIFFYAPCK